MKVKFLGQGFGAITSGLVGSVLAESLAQSDIFSDFSAYIAFLSTPMAQQLVQAIAHFTSRPGRRVQFCVGVDLEGTPKSALQELLKANAEVRVFYTPSISIYHPKTYVFSGKYNRIIIGSSNLTGAGLFRNVENSLMVEFDSENRDGQDLLRDIRTFYGSDDFYQNARPLDQSVIDLLVENKVVPTTDRQFHSKKAMGGSITGEETEVRERLRQVFPLLKIPKEPERSVLHIGSPKVQQEVWELASDYREQDEAPISNWFWVETGMLTSASRNQLDLSRTAKKVKGSGSLHLFGCDPNKKDPYSITLRYNGQDYVGNKIIFPLTKAGKSNGTFRLQMNGKTKEGDRLTDISKRLFCNAILVFREIGYHHYEVEVRAKGELDELKRASRRWDQNNGGSGRHFGVL